MIDCVLFIYLGYVISPSLSLGQPPKINADIITISLGSISLVMLAISDFTSQPEKSIQTEKFVLPVTDGYSVFILLKFLSNKLLLLCIDFHAFSVHHHTMPTELNKPIPQHNKI